MLPDLGRLREARSLPLAVLTQGYVPQTTPQRPARIEELLKTAASQLESRQFEPAHQTASQALFLSRQRGDKAREARATNLLAVASFYTGRTSRAINFFKRALPAADAADGVGALQINALSRTGALLLISGRYEDALFFFQHGLRLSRQQKDQAGEVRLLGQLGKVYAETADYAKATQYLHEALPLAQAQADRVAESGILRQLMLVEKGRGAPDAALQFGERALALTRRPVRSAGGMELLYQLGTVYAALDRQQKAAELFEQALKLARELKRPRPAAFILGDFAATQLKSGDAVAARDSAAQALDMLRRSGGNKHLESRLWATLAEAQRALGQKEEALTSYRAALAALEQARALSIPTEISRAGIVASRQQVFAGAIELLLSLARPEEAFDVAESYHARAFLDVLAEAGLDSMNELNPAEQAQEDQLFDRISGIQKELWQPEVTAEREEQLERQLAEAENALELFRLEQRRADPRYARAKAPPPLPHERVAAEVLDSETALVEYVLGDKQSFAWVVFRGRVSSVRLAPGSELTEAVAAYRTAAAGKVSSQAAAQAIAKLKAQSQPLYQKLFQPLEPYLVAARQLIIVPDGALAWLPFEALAGEPKHPAAVAPYLIERFAISYAPSASALAALRALRQNAAEAKGIVAFGDPVYVGSDSGEAAPANAGQAERGYDFRRLPYTRTEVNEIAALFPPAERRVFLGTAAQEQSVKTEPLTRYRYVHFATHALIDEEYPARSMIVLSAAADSKEDGALQMSEVMRLRLNADLVTLSACRTGLGRLLNGEGIIGLTRAFLYAGAESVVVSLWNVNDIATATLMKGFYKNLRRGLARDEALRQAKLELIRGRQQAWHHPYYWAAFVLVGDPH
ncbi:MAG TPA: CHAT domain-containing protein [Blastocatellia bacterium]|nr:CHAT domain-containing protein [Blastocatellia bacterium]